MSYSSSSTGPGEWRVPGYEHLRELGSGAFGRVVLAARETTGEQVAIKYLNRRLLSDPRFAADFAGEARLLAGVRSPHVARLLDYVQAADGAAIVMELVDGVALRKIIESAGPTGPEPALAVLKGSLLGLAAAHAAGVVHRDYKPENVLVTAEGRSALVDFGIATRVGSDAYPAGTPPYMAPEQWRSGPASPATDVYAATVVFYECVVGHRPYSAPTPGALAVQHLQAPIPVEPVPEPLRELVYRGLAKNPAVRPSGAAAFVTELEAVAVREYGPDWEQRGLRALAMLAAALSALFPLAALGSSGTVVVDPAAGAGDLAAGPDAVTAQQGAPGDPGAAQPDPAAAFREVSAPPADPPPPPAHQPPPRVRAARRAGVKAAAGAAAGVVAVAALIGGYGLLRSSTDPAGASPPPVAASPVASPTSPAPLPDAAMAGNYRLKVQRSRLRSGASSVQRLALQNLVASTNKQSLRIAADAKGLVIRGAAGAPSQRVRRTGPYSFAGVGQLGIQGRLVVRPEDVTGGRVTRFTIHTPVIDQITKKEIGEMTVLATRR
ncbi:serine/threonine-protein kinase [Actinomadura craniellae]|uniref:serine/threonine-protein kinase n=1 Tax=Actinomadura craniellae TaxID=2231787 RepID=UPI001F341B4B|nr:serine/threonine-protein kinase [Actinomadura craniellae]